jgi:predicted nucleic acid-binding protein
VSERLFLLDASAFWRLGSPDLDPARASEVAGWIARGLVAASTPLLLESRAGRVEPLADPQELPFLWITERAERRSAELQQQMRSARQHLGIPPLDYLIAAIAEDHSASILHYDSDFERLAKYSDLTCSCEPLTPLGSIS